MQVHANAPLGPKGRLTMVLRVVEQGWSVTEAAAGRRSQRTGSSTWKRVSPGLDSSRTSP